MLYRSKAAKTKANPTIFGAVTASPAIATPMMLAVRGFTTVKTAAVSAGTYLWPTG